MSALELPTEARRELEQNELIDEHVARFIDISNAILVWAGERQGARVEWAAVDTELSQVSDELEPFESLLSGLNIEYSREVNAFSDWPAYTNNEDAPDDTQHVVWNIASDMGVIKKYWGAINGSDEIGFFLGYPDKAIEAFHDNTTISIDSRRVEYTKRSVSTERASKAELLTPYKPSKCCIEPYLDTGEQWYETLEKIAEANNLSRFKTALHDYRAFQERKLNVSSNKNQSLALESTTPPYFARP